jgi:hypothetical protein
MSGVTAATMATVAMYTAAAGAAVSTYGAIKQGQAANAQAKAQADAQEYNAQVQRNNADTALAQANSAEERQRREFGQLQGQAIAGIAQSGTGFGGSNADVLKQNAINNELDALTIRYGGQTQSQGLMAQSELDRFNANASRQAGKDAMTAGYINAGASLLNGASNYSGMKAKIR